MEVAEVAAEVILLPPVEGVRPQSDPVPVIRDRRHVGFHRDHRHPRWPSQVALQCHRKTGDWYLRKYVGPGAVTGTPVDGPGDGQASRTQSQLGFLGMLGLP